MADREIHCTMPSGTIIYKDELEADMAKVAARRNAPYAPQVEDGLYFPGYHGITEIA